MKKWWIVLILLQYTQSSGKHCSSSEKPLEMTVLYESLCEDSQKFLTNFWPVFEEFHRCINLTLVAHGNAKRNKKSFKCQHGREECWGNKMQNCAFHSNLTQLQKLKFAVCQMKSVQLVPKKSFKCAKSFHIEHEVKHCLKLHSNEYQNEAARITEQYDFSAVPAIIFNGVYNASIQKAARSHVHQTLCSILTSSKHISPDDCYAYGLK